MDPEDRFPEVSRDILGQKHDILLPSLQPDLRAVRFERCGTECVFLVNAGETDIETEASLPFAGKLGQYDLWAGRAYRFHGTLTLPRRGSLLLFACGEDDFAALPEKPAPAAIPVPAFTLVSHDPTRAVKVYEAELPAGDGALTVEADEAAALSVNGAFAGVSFWSPHTFDLTGLLTEDRNRLTLTVAGSKANLYGKKVPYGLKGV